MKPELLPWLQQSWGALYRRHDTSGLPHAILVEGSPGIGKTAFVEFVAASLLCEKQSAAGLCGQCKACKMIQADTHPDLSRLNPEAGSEVIKIDAVRELVGWLQLTPQYRNHKIAIINPAESMNRNAANALLKTLEEPAESDLIFLVTANRSELPATVLSRCQRIQLQLEDASAAQLWLKQHGIEDGEKALAIAGGGPLLAVDFADSEHQAQRLKVFNSWSDIIKGKASIARSSEALADMPTRFCLSLMSSWVADIIKLSSNRHAEIRSPDLRCELTELSQARSAGQWFTLYDRLVHLYRTDSASFKSQAVLEGIFADIRLD